MLSKDTIISVVIPAYNRSGSIIGTLDSVRRQTLQSFECIIVDDGSSDGENLRLVVESFGDERFRYIRRNNGGGSAARNTGIESAKGQYVAFLDSDDFFLPHHLEASLAICERQEGGCAYAQVLVERDNGLRFLKPPRALRPTEHMAEYLLCDRGFVQPSTLMVPIGLARAVLFRDGLPFGQDTDFAIRLWRAGGRFIMADEPGAIWMDYSDPKRVSAGFRPEVRLAWHEAMGGALTEKAIIADRGWFVAKSLARNGQYLRASKLYLHALLCGCYGLKLSLAVAGQIFVPPWLYRKVANIIVHLGSGRAAE